MRGTDFGAIKSSVADTTQNGEETRFMGTYTLAGKSSEEIHLCNFWSGQLVWKERQVLYAGEQDSVHRYKGRRDQKKNINNSTIILYTSKGEEGRNKLSNYTNAPPKQTRKLSVLRHTTFHFNTKFGQKRAKIRIWRYRLCMCLLFWCVVVRCWWLDWTVLCIVVSTWFHCL